MKSLSLVNSLRFLTPLGSNFHHASCRHTRVSVPHKIKHNITLASTLFPLIYRTRYLVSRSPHCYLGEATKKAWAWLLSTLASRPMKQPHYRDTCLQHDHKPPSDSQSNTTVIKSKFQRANRKQLIKEN